MFAVVTDWTTPTGTSRRPLSTIWRLADAIIDGRPPTMAHTHTYTPIFPYILLCSIGLSWPGSTPPGYPRSGSLSGTRRTPRDFRVPTRLLSG